MRVALCIHFQKLPAHMKSFTDDIDGLVTDIEDYHSEDYQCSMMPSVQPKDSSTTFSTQSNLDEVELSITGELPPKDGFDVSASLNSSAEASSSSMEAEKLSFTCGNPDVQIVHGIMHFYNDLSKCGQTFKSDLVCMLAVPTMFNLLDILNLVAPYTVNINGIRIIRDRNPNTFMVLIRFTNVECAEEFYVNQHGQPYNSLEDSICHLAFVSNLEFGNTEVHMKSLAAGPLIELPHCAVCLEHMDEKTTGMLTVLCNHTFHCDCMTKCTTCPVCRFQAVPPDQSSHSCMVCGNTEGLWLCLICGYVGCGRYEGGHARGHFERTNHTYSMDVEQRCVWDYIGDNYVHRLIQNKADGKIVAVQDQDGMLEEKFESLTLEYTYLLTQQLESQREFFEKKLLFVEEEAMDRILCVEAEVQKATEECSKYQVLAESSKSSLNEERKRGEEDRKRLEKKLETLNARFQDMEKELGEERELNKSLRSNQREWIAKVVSGEEALARLQSQYMSETQELREQIKDLMFHLQSQAAIGSSPMREDIQSGEVHMVQGPSNEQQRPLRRSPRKKK